MSSLGGLRQATLSQLPNCNMGMIILTLQDYCKDCTTNTQKALHKCQTTLCSEFRSPFKLGSLNSNKKCWIADEVQTLNRHFNSSILHKLAVFWDRTALELAFPTAGLFDSCSQLKERTQEFQFQASLKSLPVVVGRDPTASHFLLTVTDPKRTLCLGVGQPGLHFAPSAWFELPHSHQKPPWKKNTSQVTFWFLLLSPAAFAAPAGIRLSPFSPFDPELHTLVVWLF